MTLAECTVCDHARILTKCSRCGRHVCYNCYVTRHAVCIPCAQALGLRVPHRFFRAMA